MKIKSEIIDSIDNKIMIDNFIHEWKENHLLPVRLNKYWYFSRMKIICEMWLIQGLSYSEIGRRTKRSRERIRQIIHKFHRYIRKEYAKQEKLK